MPPEHQPSKLRTGGEPGAEDDEPAGQEPVRTQAQDGFAAALERLDCEPTAFVEALVHFCPDDLMLVDPDLTILAVRPRESTLLGWRPDDMVGQRTVEFLSPEERSGTRMVMDRLSAGDLVPVYQRRVLDRGGNVRSVDMSAVLLRKPSGDPAALLSMIRDATARERVENMTRLLIGDAPTVGELYLEQFACALSTTYDLAVVGVCRVEQGWDGPEFAGLCTVVDGELVEDGPVVASAAHGRSDLSGTVRVAESAHDVLGDDPDLRELGIEFYLAEPLRARSGEVLGLIYVLDRRVDGFSMDDWLWSALSLRAGSELEHASQARDLERERQRRERLLAKVPAVIYENDLELSTPPRVLGGSPLEVTGYTADEWQVDLDARWAMVDERDHGTLTRVIGNAIRRQTGYRVDYRLRTPDGELRWIRDEAVIVRQEGCPHWVGVLTDVTVQRKLEQQVADNQRLQSLGVLAAGVAHDFNKLLMTSIGQLSILQDEAEPESKSRELLAEAEDALLRASGLTRQLQSLAKGGAPIRRPCDFERLVRRTVEFACRGRDVDCDVTFDIAADLPLLMADEGQLSQVIENLIINAQESSKDGARCELEIEAFAVGSEELASLEVDLPSGEYLVCRVSDHGPGIEPAHLRNIFDPYFTTKSAGSGLGLASSHAIVRRHGGQLLAESRVGLGTTMTVCLPLMEEGVVEEGDPEDVNTTPEEGRLALVLDDDPAVRRVVSRLLQRIGFEVLAAETGEQAVRMVETAQQDDRVPALALIDLTLQGGMDGATAAENIRQIAPSLPLVVTSGYSESPIMANHAQHGFFDCLPKPYRMQDLRRLIARIESGASGTAS